MIRSIEQLQRDQAAILASYRDDPANRETIVSLPRPGGVTAIAVYARVSAVIASDPTYGPHLMVVRQKWTGTPPMLVDAPVPESRCYPSPNHAVTAYTVGQVVRLVAAHGAMIAEWLA